MVIIMSSFKDNKTPETNKTRHESLRGILNFQGFLFQEVEGQYEGRRETSVICFPLDLRQEEEIYKLAWAFGQETVLVMQDSKDCFLLSKEINIKYVGVWIEVEAEKISEIENWSKIGERFFTVRRED